jgi:brefeldin A-resistance guanine nucleotide exchange factor 1
MSSDISSNKNRPSPEEQEATKSAQSCIEECHIEQLIHDTKFLRVESLLELVKALIFASHLHDAELNLSGNTNGLVADSLSISSGIASGSSRETGNGGSIVSSSSLVEQKLDTDSAIFSLEMLIKVVLQNRDRISCIWPSVRNHFFNIIINANDYSFFLERAVVGLLRITARLLRREELANDVLTSLRMLLMFKKKSIVRKLSRQVSFGIHDLLRTNAPNISSSDDWSTVFSILQVYGAGANAPLIATQYSSQTELDEEAMLARSSSFENKLKQFDSSV